MHTADDNRTLRGFLLWHNLRRLIRLTIFGTALGSCFANLQADRWNLASTLGGALDGLLITGALAAYHLFVYGGGRSHLFQRAPFAGVLALNTFAYSVCIVSMRTVGHLLRGLYNQPLDALRDPLLLETTVVVMILSVAASFSIQVAELIGPRDLFRFFAGRYHRPRTEARIFLFVDLTGSTSIAERIGPLLFLRFVDQFFRDMSAVVLRTGAEVYKYVGDEAIMSWPNDESAAQVLHFSRYLQEALVANKQSYLEQFGLVPRFRAAAHAGSVVCGEVGLLKREIAYMGDVLNVNARVLSACRKLGADFLCTEDLLQLLMIAPGESLRAIGRVQLRGRVEPVQLFAATPLQSVAE